MVERSDPSVTPYALTGRVPLTGVKNFSQTKIDPNCRGGNHHNALEEGTGVEEEDKEMTVMHESVREV